MMHSLKNWSQERLKEAGAKLLRVADRADERGGELRDRLKDKIEDSERLTRFREVLRTSSSSERSSDAPAQSAAELAHESVQSSLSSRVPTSFSYSDPRKPAQVFGTRRCPWSDRAVRLLESEEIETSYVDLDHPASGPMRDELQAETGQRTVPYIYIRGKFIGGYSQLDEIHRLGQLEYLTLPESERRKHPDHGRIEIM